MTERIAMKIVTLTIGVGALVIGMLVKGNKLRAILIGLAFISLGASALS